MAGKEGVWIEARGERRGCAVRELQRGHVADHGGIIGAEGWLRDAQFQPVFGAGGSKFLPQPRIATDAAAHCDDLSARGLRGTESLCPQDIEPRLLKRRGEIAPGNAVRL